MIDVDQSSRPRSFVPRLDVLEDRTVPSTFTVTNFTDHDPGSLRAAIMAANADPGADTVNFAPAWPDGPAPIWSTVVGVFLARFSSLFGGSSMPSFFAMSWLKTASRQRTRSAKASRGKERRPNRFRPQIEALEDRTVPSTLTVTSALDNGSAGTLRAVIAPPRAEDLGLRAHVDGIAAR